MNAILLSLILSVPMEWKIEAKELPDGDEMQKITATEFTGQFGKWQCTFTPRAIEYPIKNSFAQVLTISCALGEFLKGKVIRTHGIVFNSLPCVTCTDDTIECALPKRTLNGDNAFVLVDTDDSKKKATVNQTRIDVSCTK